ncbi:MAG: hypothetical protein ACFFCM_21590 [Promethearchaeota archaeon]
MVLNNNNIEDLKFLILRIIRKDPNLIPEIIRNPLLISNERISRQDALTMHNLFQQSNISNRILNQFRRNQLENFAVELQNLLGIIFTDEDLIAIEIEEINRSIPSPIRSLRFLPPNAYVIRNIIGYIFKINYFLKTKFIHKSNEIYALITISEHCDDILTETFKKSMLLDHIYNDRTYHFECKYCHRCFCITPSLLEFC